MWLTQKENLKYFGQEDIIQYAMPNNIKNTNTVLLWYRWKRQCCDQRGASRTYMEAAMSFVQSTEETSSEKTYTVLTLHTKEIRKSNISYQNAQRNACETRKGTERLSYKNKIQTSLTRKSKEQEGCDCSSRGRLFCTRGRVSRGELS